MAFIKTQRPGEVSGEVREMYRRREDYWGYVPNYAKPFSHRPDDLLVGARSAIAMRARQSCLRAFWKLSATRY